MEMQGSRQLAATQRQAWDAINDPRVLQACIPGCESMEVAGPNAYNAVLALKVGPVAARFNGKVGLSEVDAPQACTIVFDGQGGAAGFGRGSAKVRITPLDAGCLLAYDVHAQVGGKLAQVGQRLIDGVARSMAEEFFRRLESELLQRHPDAVRDDAAPAPARPGVPRWVWAAGAAAVALAAWFVLR